MYLGTAVKKRRATGTEGQVKIVNTLVVINRQKKYLTMVLHSGTRQAPNRCPQGGQPQIG